MVNQTYMRDDLESKTAHAIEECGELIAALGKTLKWGWESFSPHDPDQIPNYEWVRSEAEDVHYTVHLLLEKLQEVYPKHE